MEARDLCILVGVALIGAGVGFIFWPAALIVVGCLALTVGVLAYRTTPGEEEFEELEAVEQSTVETTFASPGFGDS